MVRMVRLPLMMLMLCLMAASAASATTYYVAANGSDSNNGTSKSAPWLHAPGMNGCAGVCASTTPKAGDQFILRGGDTWHAFGTPSGLTWSWTWSGSGASSIYVGVDKSWYSGSAWTRPLLSGDNPLTTSFVSSCAHDEYQFTFVSVNANYVDFDDLEFSGMCVATPMTSWPIATHFNRIGTHVRLLNSYIHGWSIKQATGTDSIYMINGSGSAGASYNEVAYDVIDGADSSGAPSQPSGWPLYADGYSFHHNVVRYTSNGFNSPNNITFAHDNLFEHIVQSWDSTSHSGIIEGYGAIAGQPQYIYNNLTRNTNAGITFSPTPGSLGFWFNNVFYGIGNSTNCFQVIQTGTSTSTVDYFFNNTVDAPCSFRFLSTQAFMGTANFQNNHYVGFANFSSTLLIQSSPVINDNGNEIFQTESTANSQGYTPADNYAPTSANAATVSTGANLTNICDLIPDSDPSNACKSGSPAGVLYDAVNHVVVLPPTPPTRSTTGAWDVGAFEYSSSSSQLNPPTGLSATVQ